MFYTIFETVFCNIAILGNEKELKRIILLKDSESFLLENKFTQDDSLFCETKKQILEYLSGKRKQFDLKIAPTGSNFEKTVWQAILEIPYGKTASYLDIAKKINKPKACRTVGNANNKNPLPIIIPCHRIILNNGEIGGYGYGIEMKRRLLDIEKGNINKMWNS